ncbi:ATP/GTP-binding protein [Kitasatospora sp. NBC_01287]|uniref:ATP/GTP-binding protein n=1 Tax=Kitasatospora sp. NBC_01287 TaxID=2903573 RepID=UPI00224DE337|nr:ATP/GTP-binding protein [Kitasatospora sp. NBC_01287]MCX4746721.1 ATP/GTP-binding protein [Kitasatospora sp. NBC_01287]
MSPRRNRISSSTERGAEPAAPLGGSLRRTESFQGEEWVVQTVAGTPGRFYRCPGCDQEIPPGTGHVVAWPDHGAGVEDRRHWHRACWGARERRGSAVQRGRGAPRY